MQTHPARSATERGFDTAVERAAALAAFSPSSHNCQPWALLRPAGEPARTAARRLLERSAGSWGTRGGTVELVLAMDRGRVLTSLPAHAGEMLLSCGMYGQLLLRALEAQGWSTDALVMADGRARGAAAVQWEALRRPGLPAPLAVVALRPTGPAAGGDRALDAMEAAVRERRTNRGPYQPTPVDREVLAALGSPAGHLATGARVSVRHLRGPVERRRVSELVAQYAGRDFSHPAAWPETYSYIRRDEDEARSRGDGFTLEQLFGPMAAARRNAMRMALAPRTMRALRGLHYDRFLAGQLAALTAATPVVTAVGVPAEEPSDAELLRAGAWLVEFWLRAAAQGLALHPVSVLLQHDDVREEAQRVLGLPGRTVFLSRLGFPKSSFPQGPRRPVRTDTL